MSQFISHAFSQPFVSHWSPGIGELLRSTGVFALMGEPTGVAVTLSTDFAEIRHMGGAVPTLTMLGPTGLEVAAHFTTSVNIHADTNVSYGSWWESSFDNFFQCSFGLVIRNAGEQPIPRHQEKMPVSAWHQRQIIILIVNHAGWIENDDVMLIRTMKSLKIHRSNHPMLTIVRLRFSAHRSKVRSLWRSDISTARANGCP